MKETDVLSRAGALVLGALGEPSALGTPLQLTSKNEYCALALVKILHL
jgi:hypothetical protein